MPATWMGREATSVIAAAYTLAAAGRRTVIAEEHLLEALVSAARGAYLLAPLTLATVQNEIVPAVAQARHAGGLSCGDRRALAGLGLDVADIMSRTDALLEGGNASLGPARPSGGWSQRMNDEAALALTWGEDAAVDEACRVVGVDHLALGLAGAPSLIQEHLAARGVTVDSVSRRRESEEP